MEITNNKNKPLDNRILNSKNIFLGVVMITVGVLWLLKNFDLIDYRFFDIFFSWEMLLIVIGCYLLTVRRWIAGGIVIAVGGAFMLTNLLGIDIPVSKLVVPFVFVAAGISILFTRKNM